MSSPVSRWLRGFPPALRGLRRLVQTERHARFHLVATLVVVALAVLLEVPRLEAVALTLAVGAVWTAEALNSALERLADRVTRERDAEIGEAKDLAAGAVLASATMALLVGAFVLGPRLVAWIAAAV